MQVYNAFISYRRVDGTETAKKLYDYLTEKGLDVFFDTEKLVDGHRFTTQIATALLAAPHYIFIGSKDAFRLRENDPEDWVRKELEMALEHYKVDMGNRTITVLLPDGTPIPPKSSLPEKLQTVEEYQIISGTSPESLARILKVVTAVSHANLWHGAYHWLQNQKAPGGRFCNKQVLKNLLPNTKEQLPNRVIDYYGNRDLLDAVRETDSHMYLIGEGGIGKTTALLNIMNNAYEDKAYDENAVVPVFVELSTAPDTFGRLYQGGSSSFIRRSIYRQIRNEQTNTPLREAMVEELDDVFNQPYESVVKPLDELLAQQKNTPQYLLLLDGLNEISTVFIKDTNSTVAQMVMEEIRHLATCPNVRLVLTSRSHEQAIQDDTFARLELAGVSDDVIYRYLMEKKCDTNINPAMLEILRIPLFLIMYAELSATDGICTKGEILHRFFSSRKSMEYSVQTRLQDIVKAGKQTASAVATTRIEPQMHGFVLDFILPEIGWYMEQNETFRLSGRLLRQIIWSVLTGCEDTDICGEFGMDAFTDYHTTATVAKALTDRLGGDKLQVCQHIIDLCTFNLGILQHAERDYVFTHQHIRDYFAAKKGINTLTLATYMLDTGEAEPAFDCMEAIFGQRPADMVVRQFIGQILQEHRNLPVEKNGICSLPQQGLIAHALDIYRGRFPGGKAIAILVDILKASRRNLAGCDFSRLDLSGCNLNGAPLCFADLQANFTGALIHGNNLLHQGHTSFINTVTYADNGRYVITAGNDGKVLRYDAATDRLHDTLAMLDGPVWFGKILSTGCLLTVREGHRRNQTLTPCEKCLVEQTDLQTQKITRQLELPNEPLDVRLSADEKLLLIRQCGLLLVINADDLQVVQRHTFSQENMIAEFLGNTYTVLLSDGSTLHALTGEKGQFLPKREESQYIWRAAVRGNTLCTLTQESNELLRLEVYRLKDGKCLHSFTQPWQKRERLAYHDITQTGWKYVNLIFSDTGKWLALNTPVEMFIYETNQWQLKQCLQPAHNQFIDHVAFFDESNRMAVGTLTGHLFLCETAGFTPVHCSEGIPCGIRDLGLSADGETLVTFSADGVLRSWNLQTGTLVATRMLGHGLSTTAALTKDGNLVLVKQPDCRYYTLPELLPYTGNEVLSGYSQISRETDAGNQICIYKDGGFLYSVCGLQAHICPPYLFVEGHSSLNCYDLSSGLPLWGNAKMPPFSFLGATERYLLTEEEDFVLYDSATGDYLCTIECDMLGVSAELFGEYLFLHNSFGSNHTTEIYQLSTEQLLQKIDGQARLSDDGKWMQIERVTMPYAKHQLEIYSLQNNSLVETFPLPAADIPYLSAQGITYGPIVNNRFTLCRSEESVCVYQLTHCDCKLIGQYTIAPGMDIIGLDLSDLHPDSQITPWQKTLLRAYGADF